MTTTLDTHRQFEPGTLGWTVDDLDDPEVEREWLRGRYEIVDGVLTKMPAACFPGGAGLFNLMRLVSNQLEQRRVVGQFSVEVDVVLRKDRVARADAVLLMAADVRRQKAAARKAGRSPDLRRTRILVPPTLVIESSSPGHEHHDRETKRRWYAEAGVPNYWILDALEGALDCLVLAKNNYRSDRSGRGSAKVKPGSFPGLVIELDRVWGDLLGQ